MDNNKIARIGFLIYLVCLIILMIIIDICGNKEYRERFKAFNEANIVGIVDSVSAAGKVGAKLKMEDGKEYEFHPLINKKLNHSTEFEDSVEKGDSIVKAAFSDTLYWKHGQKWLRFTFSKPREE